MLDQKYFSISISEGNISIKNGEGELTKEFDENQSMRSLIDEFCKMLDDQKVPLQKPDWEKE